MHARQLVTASRTVSARRCRYYSSISSAGFETVTIPCKSNGYISLHIHRPPTPTSRLVLHLPDFPQLRPLGRTQAIDAPVPSTSVSAILAQPSSAAANVVTVNFRLPFPDAIHDTLTAYDWCLRHLTPQRSLQRVGVYGDKIGGSLATMLALTECRLGEGRVVVAALRAPVLDWVALDILDRNDVPQRTGAHNMELAASHENELATLRRLRRMAFPSTKSKALPFDPCASPLLFLRTPGITAPQNGGSADDNFAALLGLPTEDDDAVDGETPEKPRRRALAYPPRGLALQIPHMQFTADSDTLLYEQAHELVRLLRRAEVKMTTRAGTGDMALEDAGLADELDAAHLAAERKFRLEATDHNDSERLRIETAGRWIGGHL